MAKKRKYEEPAPVRQKDRRMKAVRDERGTRTRHDDSQREEDWWDVPGGSPIGRIGVQVNVPGSNAAGQDAQEGQ